MMKPGDIVKGLVECTVCPVLNDLSQKALVPSFLVQKLVEEHGISKLWWPLGVVLLFVDEGLILCAYGSKSDGSSTVGAVEFPMVEDQVHEIGVLIWSMWKALRSVPEAVTIAGHDLLLAQYLRS